MFTLNFKTIFKQVDFWLQILAIFIIPIFYYFEVFSFFRIYILNKSLENTFNLVYFIAILQILSAISKFLIYKSERNKYRKFYEKFTLAFLLVLVITFIFANLTQDKTSYIDSGSLIVGISLLFISPFLAMWYLSITFREFLKTLKFGKFGNWWQVPLVLSVLILVIFGFLEILTPQRY